MRNDPAAAGGDGGKRLLQPECSFCGKARPHVRTLIAGAGVHICDQCIDRADRVVASGRAAATPVSALKRAGADVTTAECSFCGKRRHQVSGLALSARATICTECLALCHEIVAGQLS